MSITGTIFNAAILSENRKVCIEKAGWLNSVKFHTQHVWNLKDTSVVAYESYLNSELLTC